MWDQQVHPLARTPPPSARVLSAPRLYFQVHNPVPPHVWPWPGARGRGVRWERKASPGHQGRTKGTGLGVGLKRGEAKDQVGKVGLRTAQEVFQLWAWEFLEKSRGFGGGRDARVRQSEEGPGASLGSQQDRVRPGRRPRRKGVQRQSREGGWCVSGPLAEDWRAPR